MSDFDIDVVMREIQAEALSRIPKEENLPQFFDLFNQTAGLSVDVFNLAEYSNYLALLNCNWNKPLNRPIVRYAGPAGTVKYFFKRLIRKAIHWYLAPVILDMNENMARNVNIHNQISRFISENREETEATNVRITILQEQLNKLDDSLKKGMCQK